MKEIKYSRGRKARTKYLNYKTDEITGKWNFCKPEDKDTDI